MAQRPHRRFTAEFKRDVAELFLSGERTVAELCTDFDVGETAVRRWIEQTRDGRLGGDARPPNVAQSEELEALRKENLTLRMERDILKRAMAFFAKETR